MGRPKEQYLLVDKKGKRLNLDDLEAELRRDTFKILADDDVGLILYVADLDIYELRPTGSGEFLASKVTQISRPRFPVRILRRQIGARVFSVTADAVFVVRTGKILKKVRAENLKPGMILESGEKVFI